ncbi:MAG: peptidylprolyl isomerase [Akkermansiaceae bacterium]|nr:peptidylprolyl isomerase [Akkermansiaceae bacterium]
MKFTILILLLATLAHAAPADVLGKVGDIEITSTDVREMIAGLDAEQQAALAKDPEALGQYVRALLVQRLVLKQALDQKWDQEPAVISKLVRAREAALTESFLQNASVSNASYPSAEELSAAYEVAKSKLIIPRSYKLAQIYIAKDKAKMESISKQIKAKGADFATIARSSSEESTSAAKGGEIGWLTEDQIQPEIREKILTLAPGKVGEPVSLQDGWHLIKVLEIREPRTPALDEIRDNLVTQLRKDRSRSLRQEYLATLLKDHPLAINEIELTKLVEKP